MLNRAIANFDQKILDQIHHFSIEILDETGIRFPSEQALEVFKKHGFRVDGETVLDVRELKHKVTDQICIFDNINPNGPLLIGTPDEVTKETLVHLERAKGMSGYIFSTAGTTSPFIPKENFVAMNNEVLKFDWR